MHAVQMAAIHVLSIGFGGRLNKRGEISAGCLRNCADAQHDE
jgi:hypothetical protein